MTVWTDSPNDNLNRKNNANYETNNLNDLNISWLMHMICKVKERVTKLILEIKTS